MRPRHSLPDGAQAIAITHATDRYAARGMRATGRANPKASRQDEEAIMVHLIIRTRVDAFLTEGFGSPEEAIAYNKPFDEQRRQAAVGDVLQRAHQAQSFISATRTRSASLLCFSLKQHPPIITLDSPSAHQPQP